MKYKMTVKITEYAHGFDPKDCPDCDPCIDCGSLGNCLPGCPSRL